jgi:hypothetical protein
MENIADRLRLDRIDTASARSATELADAVLTALDTQTEVGRSPAARCRLGRSRRQATDTAVSRRIHRPPILLIVKQRLARWLVRAVP